MAGNCTKVSIKTSGNFTLTNEKTPSCHWRGRLLSEKATVRTRVLWQIVVMILPSSYGSLWVSYYDNFSCRPATVPKWPLMPCSVSSRVCVFVKDAHARVCVCVFVQRENKASKIQSQAAELWPAHTVRIRGLKSPPLWLHGLRCESIIDLFFYPSLPGFMEKWQERRE